MSLAGADVRRVTRKDRGEWCFQASVPSMNRVFVLEAESTADMSDWIVTLQQSAGLAKARHPAADGGASPASAMSTPPFKTPRGKVVDFVDDDGDE